MVFLRIVKIFLEVVVAELVSVLIFAVFVGVDLYGVVGEVDELILGIVELELIAAGSDISLIVPVSFDLAILYKPKCTNRHSSM